MLKKILVPLDGSPVAEQVLPVVEDLAGRARASLVLLTVIQPVGIWDATAAAVNWEREETLARGYLEAQAEKLRAKGLTVTTKLDHGDGATKILETADREDVHLIVMSTHGRSGITRWLFGSVADRVVHSCHMPLLLLRSDRARPLPTAVAKVLVPLDGSEVAASVLPFVEEVAKLYGASLVLYHAIPPVTAYPGFEMVNPMPAGQMLEEMQKQAQEVLSQTARELEGRGLKVTVAVSIDLAADGILYAAKSTNADLIGIGTHGRSGLGRMVLGSVANAVVRRSDLPVLLMHPPPD